MKISALLLVSGVIISLGLSTALAGGTVTRNDGRPLPGDNWHDFQSSAASNPGATTASNVAAAELTGTKPGEASEPGTGRQTADQRSGTREMNAAAGPVAASAEDVSRQQEGRPTMAQAADQMSERLPLVKAKLDQARLLDEQGNSGCMTLVNEARQAIEAK